ncbi:MAG TPA: cupin domain-containing protein [Bryobacteraceae bacterium]|jgi:quercetin dioxygenase-like cupin family protein|nr:cupin domain-containing protein [Bryobacteraceae bacterium]
MECSRRDLVVLLPALAAAQEKPEKKPEVLQSKVYEYEDLPVKANGQNKSRAVLNGVTHGGFPVELHMTELGPGQAPHAPHRHAHEEIVMLRRGSLDVTIEGRTTRITPGSVTCVASGELHGWRNPGPEPAEYFVIALGK